MELRKLGKGNEEEDGRERKRGSEGRWDGGNWGKGTRRKGGKGREEGRGDWISGGRYRGRLRKGTDEGRGDATEEHGADTKEGREKILRKGRR